jgi:hypothetical protein
MSDINVISKTQKIIVDAASSTASVINVGPQGPSGVNGKTILNGTVVPAAGIGVDGDFYLNTTTKILYGPKTAGAWGSGSSISGTGGTYTAYTPTFPQGLSLGNGVVTSEYCRVNDFVHYWGRVVWGNTTSMSNFGLQVSLPVSHDSNFSSTTGMYTGFAQFRDASTGVPYIGVIRPIETFPNIASLACQNIVNTYLSAATVQTGVPFTWTTGDIITWSMYYQAA